MSAVEKPRQLWAGPADKFPWQRLHVHRLWERVPLTKLADTIDSDVIQLVSLGRTVFRVGSREDLEDIKKCIPGACVVTWIRPEKKLFKGQSLSYFELPARAWHQDMSRRQAWPV